ncbi:MAG: acetolactate synthase small subunit [Deltaproteobacteria bacterium]|nr:acetolactate synthase small subunit [Deltaproteobacteria bacterium]
MSCINRHIISALVENQHGVLAKVAGLFAARGFNIESLTVGPTEDTTISRMTIGLLADDDTLEQVIKQLRRVPTTVKVQDFFDTPTIQRELVLIRVQAAESARRLEVMEIVNVFNGKVVDLTPKDLSAEFTGSEQKIQALIECLRPFGIKELARSGKVALARSPIALR